MDADRRRGRRIEVAGPAGAGKTTFARALASKHPVRAGVTACNRSCVPLFLRLLPLLPAGYLAGELRHGRIPPDSLRSMVYLEFWLRELSAPGEGDTGVVLYDHGPFFRLAGLEQFGPRFGTGLRAWWEGMRDAWSAAMDLVIWLDAPDSLLLERIRTRDRAHPCKEMSDAEASAWLGRYRDGFESALAVLERKHPASLIRIDTSRTSPDEMVLTLADLVGSRDG